MGGVINWSEISRQITGDRTAIRRTRIPKKYAEQVREIVEKELKGL